eukprot:m.8341 g.8341  ORF g.8341 m.8341 type:complete len:373 (+) comp5113_c0_seq1:76-1194(+)
MAEVKRSRSEEGDAHWSPYAAELIQTAKTIATAGKGILAADESVGTIGKRFDGIKVENNEANRNSYRGMLFRTPGMEEAISGVILFEEQLTGKDADGTPLVKLLHDKKIVPGIKTDKGTKPLAGAGEGETWTAGLDGLLERSQEYYKAGARFAKWRAVIRIDEAKGQPTEQAIKENAWGLARYGAISQQAGLVPIIEPEVLADGTHSIQTCARVSERVLREVYAAIHTQGLLLEGTLLKPNMVTSGLDAPNRANPGEVAFYTLRTLSRTVPAAVPGIVFLSGGQSEEEASLNLSAINQADLPKPWRLSFSYGRALQASALKAWKGEKANESAMQKVFLERALANSQAQLGKYTGGAGGADAAQSLVVKNYVY